MNYFYDEEKALDEGGGSVPPRAQARRVRMTTTCPDVSVRSVVVMRGVMAASRPAQYLLYAGTAVGAAHGEAARGGGAATVGSLALLGVRICVRARPRRSMSSAAAHAKDDGSSGAKCDDSSNKAAAASCDSAPSPPPPSSDVPTRAPLCAPLLMRWNSVSTPATQAATTKRVLCATGCIDERTAER